MLELADRAFQILGRQETANLRQFHLVPPRAYDLPMANYTSSDEMIASVAGVRFTTTARQDTEDEEALQRIQEELADGVVLLPGDTTLPHLSLTSVKVISGPTHAVITLWVPKAKETRARELLLSEGFVAS